MKGLILLGLLTNLFCQCVSSNNATSRSAKRFLEELLEKAPFPTLSIQVDGGSEFRQDFEDFCEERKIPLIVLPPAKPTYNGGVERGNKTFREEFYTQTKSKCGFDPLKIVIDATGQS